MRYLVSSPYWLLLCGVVFNSVVVTAAQEWGTPHSTVIALDGSNLQSSLDDPSNPLWLLKFYAPWCGHCKRMAPILDKVAPVLQGKLAIGKIDCTVDKKTCDAHKVRGYPTLKFAMDGQMYDYPGGRSADDIIAFAEKMNRPAVQQDVASIADVYAYARTETETGVVFVSYTPSEKDEGEEESASSSLVTQVFAQVARKQRAVDHFLQLSSRATDLTTAGISQDNEPFICRLEEHVAPQCIQDLESLTTETLLDFVKEHNFATVNKLGPQNFGKLGRAGRPLLIGVVESTSNQHQLSNMKKALLDYATTGMHRDKYYFGWLDGKQWAKFLDQFNVRESPQVFVLNVPDKTFWQNATYGFNVDAFVASVQDGTIPQDSAGGRGVERFFNKFYYLLVQYRPWSVIVLVLSVVTVAVLIASLVSPGTEDSGDYIDPSLLDPVQEGNGGNTDEPVPPAGDSTKEESKKDK